MLGWPFLLYQLWWLSWHVFLALLVCNWGIQRNNQHIGKPVCRWCQRAQLRSMLSTWDLFFQVLSGTNDYPRCEEPTLENKHVWVSVYSMWKNSQTPQLGQDFFRRSWTLEGSNKLSGRLTASRQDGAVWGNLDHLRSNSLKIGVFQLEILWLG